MARIARHTIRRLGRTTEWFIVDQIAKKIPPPERFFLLYEMRGSRATDPRVARARSRHAIGRCIDEFILVTVTRAELEAVLDGAEWLAEGLTRVGSLNSNEALCVAITDDGTEPTLLRLAARAVNRPALAPAIVDR